MFASFTVTPRSAQRRQAALAPWPTELAIFSKIGMSPSAQPHTGHTFTVFLPNSGLSGLIQISIVMGVVPSLPAGAEVQHTYPVYRAEHARANWDMYTVVAVATSSAEAQSGPQA